MKFEIFFFLLSCCLYLADSISAQSDSEEPLEGSDADEFDDEAFGGDDDDWFLDDDEPKANEEV